MAFHDERMRGPGLARPDMIYDELFDWALVNDNRTDSKAVVRQLSAMVKLQNDVRQKAVLGMIDVWGIPIDSGQGFTPLRPIPAAAWGVMQIDLTAPSPGRTEATTTAHDVGLFRNLTFSKRQIRREIKRERGWGNLVRKLRDLF